jgi:raffinose/stachyose/melibiose transport system substrate-binding protein
VKWHIRQDQFAIITQNAPLTLSGPNPPDLMRLPQVSGLVHDHLLKNLDGYFKQYHWDQFPSSQLASLRAGTSGSPRGAGSLWAMGVNFSLTGVFYNKTLAAKIGMTAAPTTLAQLDALLAKAKAAGITPIVQFNGGATGGLLFPLQQLMAAYGPPGPINNWIFDESGADINTQSNLAATTHLQQWIKAGYFNADANATDYATMMSKFEHGGGLLIFDGDWESGNFDKILAGKIGFFLMPPLKAGGKHAAMSAPLTYGIAATAKHADCAAFFLNWVATDASARKINVAEGGSNPGGPASLPIPAVKPGSVTGQTLAAGKVVAGENGAMDFIANATGAIYAQSWTPEVQKLFAGQETPQGVLKTVQADYVRQVAGGQ